MEGQRLGGDFQSIFMIVLGNYNLYQTDPGEVTHEVRKLVFHPSYDRPRHSNDVAIIQLKEPVKLNKYIGTACLPMVEYPDDKTVIILRRVVIHAIMF